MIGNPTRPQPEISVIVPISEGGTDVAPLFHAYLAELERIGRSYEMIAVVDAGQSWVLPRLKEVREQQPRLEILLLGRTFGEAAALTVGFRRARGDIVVTLPAYPQVEPQSIGDVLTELEQGADLVIGRRFPRRDSAFNRLQSWVFHWLVRMLTPMPFKDISCGLRAMRRETANELELYGDQHRFIPIMALNQGFSVAETKVRQSAEQKKLRIHTLGAYPRRLLDLLTVFFLVKFTRKPLRFFGLVGTALFVPGSLLVGYLGLYRLLGFGGIGNRPLLLMGVLLMVLGFQTLAIGLLGEIIIFVHARHLREYSVAQIFSSRPAHDGDVDEEVTGNDDPLDRDGPPSPAADGVGDR